MGHWRLNYGDLNLCIYKFKPKNIIYHLFGKYVYNPFIFSKSLIFLLFIDKNKNIK